MALSKSSSSNYLALGLKHSSTTSTNIIDSRYEAYKALITEVADSLMEEDVEKIIWFYDLPRKAARGYSPLDVLTNLHKSGKLSENNLDGLESLLERIKRKDLVEKFLTPFHQKYEVPTEVFSPTEASFLLNQEDNKNSLFMSNTPEANRTDMSPAIGSGTSPTSSSRTRSSASLPCDVHTAEINDPKVLQPSESAPSMPNGVISRSGESQQESPHKFGRPPMAMMPGKGRPTTSARPPLVVSLTSEPRNISVPLARRRLHHTQSMDNILEQSRQPQVGATLTHSISLQRLELAEQKDASRPANHTKQKSRFHSTVLGWMRRSFPIAPRASVKHEEGMLQWPVKIELIQKHIYTRRLHDKRIPCPKKLELSRRGLPPIKLVFQIHPYGTLSDANRNVSFIVEVEHQKKTKLYQVHLGTKLVLQLTISSNGRELTQYTSEEDFRLSSFRIEHMISHDALKSLDHTHNYLVLAIHADVRLSSAASP